MSCGRCTGIDLQFLSSESIDQMLTNTHISAFVWFGQMPVQPLPTFLHGALYGYSIARWIQNRVQLGCELYVSSV